MSMVKKNRQRLSTRYSAKRSNIRILLHRKISLAAERSAYQVIIRNSRFLRIE
jgi:hypothetical protein